MIEKALNKYKDKRLFLITDENVYFYYKNHLKDVLKEYRVDYIIIKPGEASKSEENYLKIVNMLLERHITRKDIIVAFGGGVVGDLSGFVAATVLRGVSFINIPTSLLAMIDSSIGSKVGIDTIYGKNLIGAFKNPLEVIIDSNYLKTLPKKECDNAMAEVIKYYLIDDVSLLEDIKNNNLENIIKKSINSKKEIITKDPFETYERMYLNFGHTFAHAIERHSNYEIPHGYAVAMGMDIAIRLGIYFNITNKEVLNKLHNLYSYYNLPLFKGNIQELVPYLSNDKKAVLDKINFVFIKDVGMPLIKQINKEVFYEISSF
ncbi:MAG: 3-dehydroquinate synthase [Acholeplasmatales bacterium]